MLHIPKKGLFSGLLFAGSRDLSLECSVYRNACLRPWAGLSQFEQLVYVSNLFMVNDRIRHWYPRGLAEAGA